MTRPQASCASCGESVDAPDSPLGHAVVAAFEDMHRGHPMTAQCPLGGPRCHEAICDCFIHAHPADPLGLHPEAYAVGTGENENEEAGT